MLFSSFFTVTPFLLLFSIVFFVLLRVHTHQDVLSASTSNSVAYAAIPSQVGTVVQDQVQPETSEVELIYQFLLRYNSRLAPYAQNIVDESHTYGLDSRLIPAIAMTESTGCRNEPKASYNCWGFGIYGHKITYFNSYPDAIHAVAKTLGEKYGSNGLVSPEQIMSHYTPSSPDGVWARTVVHFMQQIK